MISSVNEAIIVSIIIIVYLLDIDFIRHLRSGLQFLFTGFNDKESGATRSARVMPLTAANHPLIIHTFPPLKTSLRKTG